VHSHAESEGVKSTRAETTRRLHPVRLFMISLVPVLHVEPAMLERLPKLNPPLEDLIQVPPPGTVTSVSSGAGAVVPIEWLREINTNGVRPGELTPLINDLEDQAEEEDMVSAWPDDTGLSNTIKILPGNPAHGPRIKVALNPPDRFTDGSDWAW